MTERKAPHIIVHPDCIRVTLDARAIVDDAVAGDLKAARLHAAVRGVLRQVANNASCTVLVDPARDACA